MTHPVHRRNILQATAAGSVALAINDVRVGLATSTPPTGWIDAHVHVWTPDTKRYPLSPKYKPSDMVPASFTPDELLAHAKSAGVSKIVLIQMSFYEFDNRYMLDCIQNYPGTFSGVGIVNHDDLALRDTMRSLGQRGVKGFRLYTDKQSAENWERSTGIKTMWEEAADSGQVMCLLANPDALPAVHKMCQRYPRTRVVIDHFARIGLSGTIHPTELDELCRLSKFENVFVKVSAFYALGQKKEPYLDLAPMIRRLKEVYGPERLMWATDCPYQVQNEHTYSASLTLIKDKLDFLSDRDKNWMLRDTAEKVFFAN